ncbi:hypothetical protein ACWEFJ_36275 [Actinosynnema sp. NPDC004786]
MNRRLLGAALLVVAGGVAVAGTFRPLYSQGVHRGDSPPMVHVTSWEYVFTLPVGMESPIVRSPQYGVPIVVSAVLLAIAAALVFLPEAQRLAARYLAIAGTGLLLGAVWATGAAVVSAVGNAEAQDEAGLGVRADEGIAVLAGSVLVAVVGVVLLHARRPQPRPDGPVVYRVDDDAVDADTDTPPFGFPAPEVEVARLPGTGPDRRSEPPTAGA